MIFRGGGTQPILPVVEQGGVYAATYRIAMRPGSSKSAVRPIAPPTGGLIYFFN